MLSEFGIVRSMWSRWTALVLAASFAACVDDTVTPAPEQPNAPAQPRVLGFVELTFSGIGTSELSSSMISAPTLEALQQLRAERERSGDLRDIVTQDLTFPDSSGGGGNGTIQISKDVGDQFAFEGVRYLHSTFFVRNAQVGGAAYDTDRTNLTFLAVSTSSTVNQTAVSKLELAGGTPAPAALALQVLPTDLMEQVGPTVSTAHPDVLQIFTESEIAAVAAAAPAGVTSVFPYGFVVRRVGPAGATTRTLPASPAESEFDGIVDFAFSIPVQANPANDPQQLSVLLIAVDDSETQVTQGLQEQGDTADLSALRQLASALGADTVTLLPGGRLTGVSGLRTLCSVRTAGTPAAATVHLVNVDWTFQSFSPIPNSSISTSGGFQATFSAAPDEFGPESFTVRGIQSGPQFIGQNYTINGTTISTPAGSFLPGEEVEITLTSALSCPAQPPVARYRVQSGQATGGFQPDTIVDADGAHAVALGDLDGNGRLDLAVATGNNPTLPVHLNNGASSHMFPGAPTLYTVGSGSRVLAMGDLNGDGALDIAVPGWDNFSVFVLINSNDGTGTFPTTFPPTYNVGEVPSSIAIGELNGDGSLDLAVGNFADNNVSILLNNGDGTFQPHTTYDTGGLNPFSVAIGDLNNDGHSDLAVANTNGGSASVLVNNGDGTFQDPLTYSTLGPNSVAIGDLDGVNGLDLAIAGDSGATVLLNTGNANAPFPTTNNPSYPAGSDPSSVAIGDLNGDGFLDLAVANHGDDNVSVLYNVNGTGTFPTSNNPTFPVGSQPVSSPTFVAIGDLNGDGVLDIATANNGEGRVSVLVGQPTSP